MTCYRKHPNQTIYTVPDTPCNEANSTNPFTPCCLGADICLPNNLCRYSHFLEGGSGFYLGSCNDPTFQSQACAPQCVDINLPDVIYVTASDSWACCGIDDNGVRTCNTPTNETFKADAPSVLLSSTIGFVGSPATPTSSSSATQTSPTTTSSTAPPTTATDPAIGTKSSAPVSTASPNADGSLDAGAKAGIGTGVALGVVLLSILIAGAIIISRRRRARRANASLCSSGLAREGGFDVRPMIGGAYETELAGTSAQVELEDPRQPRHELGHGGSWR